MIFLENVIYIFFVINNILWFFSVIDVDLRVVFKSKTGEVPVIFSVIDCFVCIVMRLFWNLARNLLDNCC